MGAKRLMKEAKAALQVHCGTCNDEPLSESSKRAIHLYIEMQVMIFEYDLYDIPTDNAPPDCRERMIAARNEIAGLQDIDEELQSSMIEYFNKVIERAG